MTELNTEQPLLDIKAICEKMEWVPQYEGKLWLKMKDVSVPISITFTEFNFIQDFIYKHNLKIGYEVATAFGISALAAGLAFKKTNGSLVTIDSYIEEKTNSCDKYFNKAKVTYSESLGLKSVNNLVNYFNVPVYVEVGWSPDNVIEILSKHYDLNNQKLDYVFIDAAHNDDALRKDFDVIKNHIADRFVIFLHDVHCFSKQTLNDIENFLGQKLKLCHGCKLPQGFNLSMITNLE